MANLFRKLRSVTIGRSVDGLIAETLRGLLIQNQNNFIMVIERRELNVLSTDCILFGCISIAAGCLVIWSYMAKLVWKYIDSEFSEILRQGLLGSIAMNRERLADYVLEPLGRERHSTRPVVLNLVCYD